MSCMLFLFVLSLLSDKSYTNSRLISQSRTARDDLNKPSTCSIGVGIIFQLFTCVVFDTSVGRRSDVLGQLLTAPKYSKTPLSDHLDIKSTLV